MVATGFWWEYRVVPGSGRGVTFEEEGREERAKKVSDGRFDDSQGLVAVSFSRHHDITRDSRRHAAGQYHSHKEPRIHKVPV